MFVIKGRGTSLKVGFFHFNSRRFRRVEWLDYLVNILNNFNAVYNACSTYLTIATDQTCLPRCSRFTMSSAKNLQNKIFGTSSSSAASLKPSQSDLGLTINIPRPIPSATNLNQPRQKSSETPTVPGAEKSATSPHRYRDKVVTQLQSDYESVERYRLLQDERKERHWKRWGPYLSERQWVSLF